ncbi:MAG: GNAT family N-acetyltransferase [Beijerinckiaceae bacterium]
MKNIHIETGRLKLRPHTINDFEHVRKLWGNPEVVRFISGTPSTPEESWARLLRYIGHWTIFDFGFFAMIDKANGQYLGECGLMDFQREITPSLAGSAEMGWVLSPEASGKGFATEAMTAVIEWYRARPDARSLTCIIATGNTASINVATKLGLTREVETLYRGNPTSIYRRG